MHGPPGSVPRRRRSPFCLAESPALVSINIWCMFNCIIYLDAYPLVLDFLRGKLGGGVTPDELLCTYIYCIL